MSESLFSLFKEISQSRLVMQSGCGGNAKVYLSNSVAGWKGVTLKTADIQFVEGTNKVKIILKLQKNVSPGKHSYFLLNRSFIEVRFHLFFMNLFSSFVILLYWNK